MTFLGIENTNEFFTQHYLTAILQGDLRPVLERWRAGMKEEEGEARGTVRRAPPQALGAAHLALFRYLDRLEGETSMPARVAAHFEVMAGLLAELGYADVVRHAIAELPSGHVPLYGEIERADGSPVLWLLPVVSARGVQRGTLASAIAPEQLEAARRKLDRPAEEVHATDERTAEELIHEAFNLDEPPRFVLALGHDDIVLAERAKWAEQRLLRFDLREILGRRQADTLEVTAALLHRESLVPSDGIPLLDSLDDNSHKHAFEVSEDLKYALQASIERLGNAAVDYLRRVKKQKVFGTEGENEVLAANLSRECLRYMYRLLFLFYIEARPELGYAPRAEAYRLGYSLERLRELEQLDLTTEEARSGRYIHDSLRLLFGMIYDGRTPSAQASLARDQDGQLAASHYGVFELAPLRSHLFDPARTPILDGGSYDREGGVVFSNEVLREVIENMSLTWPDERRRKKRAGKQRRRGRISYATLGINQLGAVYEALLSFRGFLAKDDLFEVKPADSDEHDVLETAYFVTEADLGKYKESERVYDGKALKRYPKGTFIYRLAGRDRQTSASYYTPEVLTRATVKYALKELLEDEQGNPKLTADEILRLTVCEPAMGSAAFLNEAVNQLAEAYLVAKQRERGERIPHERYTFEKQRVKMFIADNNVFGVDLNPIAVELAGVALWLNTIHEGGFVPWFTGQTVCGNSLIGARRQVFPASALAPGKEGENADWLDTVPERVPLGTARPPGAVYHFLLGDRSMSAYAQGQEGKPIREMAKEQLAKIDEWREEFCKPLDEGEIATLQRLSEVIDKLWDKHADLLKRIRYRTTDPIQVYGQPAPASDRKPTTTAYKDKVWEEEMLSETVRASSPYRRLRLVMDYWCSLWFWPIEQADLLPSRDEYLEELARILDTTVYEAPPERGKTLDLFPSTAPEEAKQTVLELGLVNLHKIVERHPRLQLAENLSARYRFHSWELEFADIFESRGGFDLMVGNPPWLPVQWSESDVLADADPMFSLRELSANVASQKRDETIARFAFLPQYLAAHERAGGTSAFLGGSANYPLLSGSKTNLYKCFLPLAWTCTKGGGAVGMLHPENVFEEPSGGELRRAIYSRLRAHYQFQNELGLFEIQHQRRFSINIYGCARHTVRFRHISNLFHPSTVEACLNHPGIGRVPGLKDDNDDWSVGGHRDRVIEVDDEALALFASLYDEPGTDAATARLPVLHSAQLRRVLQSFGAAKRLDDIGVWDSSDVMNEARSTRDGRLVERPQFPATIDAVVLNGPHFFVANPLYKSARRTCTQNSHFDVIDLEAIPQDFLPRTKYTPGPNYLARLPRLGWDQDRTILSVARVVVARRIDFLSERTLQPAVVPEGVAHIDGVNSYAFPENDLLLAVAGSWASIPADFFLKSMGVGNLWPNVAKRFPILTTYKNEIGVRVSVLNCLTRHYARIWSESFRPEFCLDGWAKADVRLSAARFEDLRVDWTWDTPLRADYERRQALVELDVLVARGLGLTVDELITIYRSTFYVLRSYEADTWYDRRGRIVFTNSKGLVGVGLPRNATKGDPTPAWNDVKDMKSGTVSHIITDDTQPGGPRDRTITYEAPFDRCDRERDYETAWTHFEARFRITGAAND